MKKIIQHIVIFHSVLMSGALVGIGGIVMIAAGLGSAILGYEWMYTATGIGGAIFSGNIAYAILIGLVYSAVYAFKMVRQWIKSLKK